MKPLKILVISNLYPSKKNPFHGTFIKNFIENLQHQEATNKVKKCVLRGRTFHTYIKVFKYIKFYSEILFHLLFRKYDIIYVHIVTHAAIPLRMVSTIKKLPLVFNIHGEDVITQTKFAAYLLTIAKPLLVKSKMVVVPSHFFKRKVEKILPQIPSSKIFVSASGGVNALFYEKKQHNYNQKFTIGYVSRIDRGKGWSTFLKAIKILQDKNIIVKAVLAGYGNEIPLMLQLIEQLNLKDTIYLGAVPYEETPSIYESLDLFIFPTQLEESLGLVGIEAMACHTPIIGSRVGGLTDYIIDGVNGYFFNSGDEKDLADKIEFFQKLPIKKVSEIRNNAYKTALKYKADNVSQELYSQLKLLV